MLNNLTNLAMKLGETLQAHGLMLVTAESCTGGQVAQAITSVSGSACWFERGFITYSNQSKQEMLGVKTETLNLFGAVSETIAKEMAQGALANSHAQVSLAVTGIAGPTGGSPDKPVGTVCFAWAKEDSFVETLQKHFTGDRTSIRTQATEFVLRELLKSTHHGWDLTQIV